MSKIGEMLKRQNLKLDTISLLGLSAVPGDCDVLIIAGPRKRFSQQEKGVLNDYLAGGGKMLVMVDPLSGSALEDMLSAWGVTLRETIVLDPVRRIVLAGPMTLYVDDYPPHAITQKMSGLASVFSLATSVEPAGKGRFTTTSIAMTSSDAWAETRVREKKAKYDEGEDTKGPISIAVTSTRLQRQPGSGLKPYVPADEDTFRLVVFGDSDFASDALIDNPGNADLFLNSINWLAKKESLISIDSKRIVREISVTRAQSIRMIIIVCMLPFSAIIAGVLVWWRRRR